MRVNTSDYPELRISPTPCGNTQMENIQVREENPTVKNFAKAVGREDFESIVDSIKDMTQELKYTRLEFSVHDDTKRIMVKIYDKSNDELLSEIPPEKFLDLIAGLWRQAGIIVDERV